MKTKLPLVFIFGVFASIDPLLLSPPAHAQQPFSSSFCRDYADRYARRNARGGAWSGAGQGAAIGAGIGLIADGGRGAGRGAAIGAGLGAISGGTRRAVSYDRLFDRAYDDCRRGYLRN